MKEKCRLSKIESEIRNRPNPTGIGTPEEITQRFCQSGCVGLNNAELDAVIQDEIGFTEEQYSKIFAWIEDHQEELDRNQERAEEF